MKFIHFSDLRLGSFAESGFGWEEKRDTEIKENLEHLFETAEDEGTQLVLIAGGLFSTLPVESELRMVRDIFGAHQSIEVVIIAGETDPIYPSSPVRSFIWPKNVHFVLSKSVERIVLNNIDTEVYASSFVEDGTAKVEEYVKKASEKVESEAIKIALIWVNPDADDDFSQHSSGSKQHSSGSKQHSSGSKQHSSVLAELSSRLSGSEFSYVALGGPNKYREITKDLIYASGSLEPEDANDKGAHGIIRGEILPETGRLHNISFEEMASGSYVTLNVKINSQAYASEVNDKIAQEIEKRGENNIYSLHILGMRNPDENLDLGKLKGKYRIRSILDTTEPDYDYAKLFKEHPQDMIGFFIRNVAGRKNEMSAVEKRAMFYGIDALLSTSDEES